MKQSPSHTILAVNDRQDQLRELASTLEIAEFTVLKATNLTAALRLANEQQPDLIVIDLSRQHTALDLRRRVRSDQQLADTPILVINVTTASNLNDFDIDSTKDDLLETPYQPITLAAKVARLVERKRTHDAQQRYFELFHNANDVVYTHDLEGRYTSLNARGQEITGYSVEEIADVHFKDLASPEDVALAYRMLEKKLKEGVPNTVYELSVRAKDGTMIPWEVNSQLIYRNGKPVGVQGIARDIRSRKAAEEQLLQLERKAKTEYKILVERIAQLAQVLASARQLEQIFNALLEFTKISLPCDALSIALYDHETVEVTPHFLWLGGKNIDLTNAEPFPITNNSDIRRAILSAETIISASSTHHSIPLLLQSTEAIILSSSMIVPMTIMGRTIGILEIQSVDKDAYQEEDAVAVQMAANLAANTIENVRLLNRERDQETQLRQAQKMEAIGQLAGGVAHDFNNFVTTMYGLCDALLRGLEQSNPLRRYVFEMKQSATRVANLTKQLLAFGRKQVLKPEKLNLNTVLTQIMDQLLARTIGEHISIVSNLADDLPQIIADKSQLEQIVINLAINARDAIPNIGTITIETSVVNPDRKEGRKQTINRNHPVVQLSISDTGIGMSPDLQKHIFEPFFTTKGEGGTGLGLSTVYGCVKQSGGSISVDSKEGHGTTFHIQFPVAKDDSPDHAAVDTKPDAVDGLLHGKQTILIAEDDTSLRHVLTEELTNAGYTIIEAINGADALELFKQHNERIQLVITDVLMPKMNGRDLALLISDIQSGVHILYISGYAKDVITDHGVLREGVHFLEKPFDSNDLLHTVRQIFTEQQEVFTEQQVVH
ncbi:MAG: response regulator [Acidobacteria bacterium]|nr:response regulator [Acidobacteriota bacterium]